MKFGWKNDPQWVRLIKERDIERRERRLVAMQARWYQEELEYKKAKELLFNDLNKFRYIETVRPEKDGHD